MAKETALNVHYRTSRLIAGQLMVKEPVWYRSVLKRPPQTVFLDDPFKKIRRMKDRLDKYRKIFYRDHPWELARPRIVAENDGFDIELDWSDIDNPQRALTGESVVQHMAWLMKKQGESEQAAYKTALTKFYKLRVKQEILERVAKDEAVAFGAKLHVSPINKNIKKEEEAIDVWSHDTYQHLSGIFEGIAAEDEVEEEGDIDKFIESFDQKEAANLVRSKE